MSDVHLDDEAISAVLDGEAVPEDSAHADACAECDARLAALRDASLLVRTPVPPAPDDVRERAIATALAAQPAKVVPLHRPRTAPRWLAAAAAVMVVALGSVVVIGGAGDDADDDASTAADSFDEETSAAGSSGADILAAGPGTVDGGDLGAIDVNELEGIVGEALGSAERDGAAMPESTTADAADDDASAEQDVAEAAGGGGTTAACEDPLRADNPQLGALVYRATGTLDGEDVVVLAFDVLRDDGSQQRWVYVATADGCAVRNQQAFVP